ncbi:unnamed protein product, partial [Brachionus calyciflorus]
MPLNKKKIGYLVKNSILFQIEIQEDLIKSGIDTDFGEIKSLTSKDLLALKLIRSNTNFLRSNDDLIYEMFQ